MYNNSIGKEKRSRPLTLVEKQRQQDEERIEKGISRFVDSCFSNPDFLELSQNIAEYMKKYQRR